MNPRGGYMIVRQSDAHAWAEALIDGILSFFAATKRGDRWNSTKDTAMIVYAVGWGSVFVIGFAVGVAEIVRSNGSATWRGALGWNGAAILAGEIADLLSCYPNCRFHVDATQAVIASSDWRTAHDMLQQVHADQPAALILLQKMGRMLEPLSRDARLAKLLFATLLFLLQIVLAKRLIARLLFTGRETGESGRGSSGRKPRLEKPAAGELLARLTHPHIAQLLDIGEAQLGGLDRKSVV